MVSAGDLAFTTNFGIINMKTASRKPINIELKALIEEFFDLCSMLKVSVDFSISS
jgi:glycine cleavage system regulatory protein